MGGVLMQSITKWFNVLIQSWNTIFFAFLAFGGFYLMTQGSLLVGVLLMLIGLGGAWFCLQQAQKWNNVKKEDIPDIKQNMQNLWKRKKK
jgi:hypothetical protein